MAKNKTKQPKNDRGTWFGVDPRTKIVPNKKRQAKKDACRKGGAVNE